MIIPVPVRQNFRIHHFFSRIYAKYAPFLGLNFIRCNNSTAGIKNAKVFPDPVLAAPMTSLPANSGGIALACTGVIVEKPMVVNALVVGSESSRDEKGGLSGVESSTTAEGTVTSSAVILVSKDQFEASVGREQPKLSAYYDRKSQKFISANAEHDF